LGTVQEAGIDELEEDGLLVRAEPHLEMPPHAYEVLDAFAHDLQVRGTIALMIGFPSAPFIVPLATRDRPAFLEYARIGILRIRYICSGLGKTTALNGSSIRPASALPTSCASLCPKH